MTADTAKMLEEPATAAASGEADAVAGLHGPACLTQEQRKQLLRGVNAKRVHKDDRGFSHLQAYDNRAHLTRIFGFANWDTDLGIQELVFEESSERTNKKTGELYTAWTVCYRSEVRLTVKCPHGVPIAHYNEGASDVSENQPSRASAHDNAIKGSESQALKRCAVNLGDQFGISLYNKGSISPLVGRTLVHPPRWETPKDAERETEEPDAHIQTPLAPEDGDRTIPTVTADMPSEQIAVEAEVGRMERAVDPWTRDYAKQLVTATAGLPLNERRKAINDAIVDATAAQAGQSVKAVLMAALQDAAAEQKKAKTDASA